MERTDFRGFFKRATGFDPFDYQCRLACGERTGRRDADAGK